MVPFSDLGIQRKLQSVVTTSLLLAGALFGFVVLTYAYIVGTTQLTEKLSILTLQTAQRSAAAVIFSDVKVAQEHVTTLLSSNDITYVCLYGEDIESKMVNAGVSVAGDNCLQGPVEILDLSFTRLTIYEPVIWRGQLVGGLTVEATLLPLYTNLLTTAGLLFAAILTATLIASYAAKPWLKRIYLPIVHLGETAHVVIMTKDWSIRAQKETHDEIGEAVDAFNTMLTELEKDKEELEQLAFYDTLTGLPNRRLFMERLEHAIAQARRSNNDMALVFIDLDKFKEVNDTLGHDQGDILLQAVSQGLQSVMRESDCIARLGGDEFTAILQDVDGEAGTKLAVERMMAAMGQPVELAEKLINPEGSFGVALGSGDKNAIEMMKIADIALYKVKDAGRNGYHILRTNQVETHDIDEGGR